MAKKRRIKNPVARVFNRFNKPATHKDKTKYDRKNKDRKDPYFLSAVYHKYFNVGMLYII